MNVREIIKEYLLKHGFTGLCSEECGCEISDLFPCLVWATSMDYCVPGYRVDCDDEDCEYYHCEGWHVTPQLCVECSNRPATKQCGCGRCEAWLCNECFGKHRCVE